MGLKSLHYMNYSIISFLENGDEVFVEISFDKFNEIKRAKSGLLHAMFIEEKLNYITENYYEFEHQLLDISLKNMLFSGSDWSKSVDEVHSVSRRIVNLLTSCRLYLDQVEHNLGKVYGSDSPEISLLREKKSYEYDSCSAYRIFNAIRNYIQHRGLPIHLITHHRSLVESKSGRKNRYIVVPKLRVSEFVEDKKVSAYIREELKNIGEMIDIRPLIREYMESISRVHEHVRDILRRSLFDWETKIEQAFISFCEYHTRDSVGLTVAKRDDFGTYIESIEIFDDLIKRRRELEQKNQKLSNHALHFISNEITD